MSMETYKKRIRGFFDTIKEDLIYWQKKYHLAETVATVWILAVVVSIGIQIVYLMNLAVNRIPIELYLREVTTWNSAQAELNPVTYWVSFNSMQIIRWTIGIVIVLVLFTIIDYLWSVWKIQVHNYPAEKEKNK